MRRSAVLCAAACLAACGPPPASFTSGPAPSRATVAGGLRDDRVVVGSGAVVRAVGVSRRFVYAATNDVVAVYDRDRRVWLPSYTREGGFDPSQVRAIATDPDDDSAWLSTTLGAWSLQPLTGFLMRAPLGAAPPRLRVGSLDAVYREFPSVEAFGRLLTRDEAALLPWPVTSGARAPDRAEVWLGTAGGGLYQVDPLFNRAEPRPFGLATSGAGAIARDADHIWVAPAARAGDARAAISVVSRDLQSVRWLDDASRRTPSFARATAIAVTAGVAWLGTTRGLYLVRSPTAGSAATFTWVGGVPGTVVLSVLPRRDGVWVGTDAGVAVVDAPSTNSVDTRVATPIADGFGVHALLATGDTMWLGTERGLLLRAPNGSGLAVPGASPVNARLRRPVRALAASDSMVFVAVSDAVLAFNRRTGAWSEPWPAVAWSSVGGIESLASDGRSVWAGGPLGVLAVDRLAGGSRALRLGGDLPDAVTGVVLDGSWAWIGTLGGVVRVRRSADGLIP